MSLFERLRHFFRFSPPAATPPNTPEEPAESVLLEALRNGLRAAIEATTPDLRVIGRGDAWELAPLGLTLTSTVFRVDRHPTAVLCTLGVRLYHPEHFPTAIDDCLVGYGTDPAEAVANGAQIYVDGVLTAVLQALDGQHDPALDWVALPEGTRWHPVAGPLQVQGAWTGVADLDPHHFVQLLAPLVQALPLHRSFHWVKVYQSRQPNGDFIGECLRDNAPWEAALPLLQADAATWLWQAQFAGKKQFLLFRRCG